MSANRFARFFRRMRTPYLILCNTVLLLFALEIGTRLVLSTSRAVGSDPDGARRRDESIHPYFQAMRAPGKNVDPGPDLAGVEVVPADLPDDEATVRVMFLGGSTTANDYPKRVRTHLAEQGRKVKVYNFAADGASSLQSLHKFWTYVDLVKPHVLVLMHAINDFYRGFTPPGMLPAYRSDYAHFVWNRHWEVRESGYDGRPVFTEGPLHRASIGSMFSSMLHGSRLFEEVRERFTRQEDSELTMVPMQPELVLRSLPAFRRNMSKLVFGAKALGIPVLLLTMPSTPHPGGKRVFLYPGPHFTNDGDSFMNADGFRRGMQAFNDVIVDLGKDGNVTVLDLIPIVGNPALFLDEVHLNEQGRAGKARRVADALEELL